MLIFLHNYLVIKKQYNTLTNTLDHKINMNYIKKKIYILLNKNNFLNNLKNKNNFFNFLINLHINKKYIHIFFKNSSIVNTINFFFIKKKIDCILIFFNKLIKKELIKFSNKKIIKIIISDKNIKHLYFDYFFKINFLNTNNSYILINLYIHIHYLVKINFINELKKKYIKYKFNGQI